VDGIYDFDDADETLTFMPTAARRALDVAGVKLSLRAWEKMDRVAREDLVRAGAGEAVDVAAVGRLLASADPPVERVVAVADPDPSNAPPEIGEIDPARWKALRPLDRYALVKASKRAEKLERARDEILGNVTPIP
jgi:hypothetical protein